MPAAFPLEVDFTANNLLAAYQGEIDARARYLAFAEQADSEGHCGVASLFRAAARAEQIHASNQARVLRQMGAETNASAIPCVVKDTEHNVRTALAGESYEIESLYPEFIEEATARLNTTAARSFLWSLEAEKTHADLFSEVIALLEAGEAGTWIAEGRAFFVCPVCACTSRNQPEDNCAICGFPAERTETIR
jgi:rubrerythrin